MKYWLKMSLATSLALGLFGLYYWDEKRTEDAKSAEQTESAVLRFEQAAARKIRFTSAGATLIFERDSATSNWSLVEPKAPFKLEQSVVSGFVTSLATAASQMEISDTDKVLAGGDRSAFGLDKPVASVEITLDGSVTKRLDVGADVDIGTRSGGKFEAQAVYAASTDRKVIFVMSKPAVAFLSKRLLDFRSKSAVELNVANANQFAVSVQGNPKIVVKKEKDNWFVQSPRELPADQGNSTLFLNSLAKLRVDKVTEKEMLAPNRMAQFGLDKPHAVVEVSDASGKNIAVVRLGKVKESYYVEMSDGAVGSISEAAFQEVAPQLKFFRDKRVMRDAKMSDILRIRTASGKIFQKEGSNWYAVEANSGNDKSRNEPNSGVSSTPNAPQKASSAEALAVFGEWEFMAASDVVDGPDLKSMSLYGLDKPQNRLVFEYADSKASPEEILIGNKVPNDSKLVYVKRSNRSAVYLVDAGWLENLAKLDGAKAQPMK